MERDQRYINEIRNVAFNPVFIIGSHRSGTTLLYQILTQNDDVEYVSAYHVIKYSEILANFIQEKEEEAAKKLFEEFKHLGISDRVFDSIQVTPNLPEEYGFILANRGFKNFINESNLNLFKEICQKIHFTNKKKLLLLKNPWCFPHFLYIKKALPNAKFIFIHRNPINVINSKMKAVRKILSNENSYVALLSEQYKSVFNSTFKHMFYRFLYSHYFSLGVTLSTNQSVKSAQYYLHNIEHLPKPDYIETTYETLCENPNKVIDSILDFLGLENLENVDYKEYISPRKTDLLPEVEENADMIYKKLKLYCDAFDYTI